MLIWTFYRLDYFLDITSVWITSVPLFVELNSYNFITHVEHVPFAYEVYKHAKDDRQEREDEDTEATMEALHPKDVDHRAFKRTFCVPITIDFVGVWYANLPNYEHFNYLITTALPFRDTVASVGTFDPFPLLLSYIR